MTYTKRAVFFGTPEWAVPSLDSLLRSEWDVTAVVTNPDRAAGRGYETTAPPVKVRASEEGLPVHQPQRARDESFATWLLEETADVAVVVAYGKILPAPLLAIPRLGFVNVHFSLLPLYRGAAPVQRAVIDGRAETGVSIMVLTEGMDEGPVLATEEVAIGVDETAGELGGRLATVGADLLVRTLDAYAAGALTPREQDHGAATYAPKITSDEARVDWNQPARRIRDQVRGMNPAPGAWTLLRDKRLKIHRTSLDVQTRLEPGEIASGVDDLVVGAADGSLRLDEVQLAGKRRMSGADLARGVHPARGERLR